MNEEILAGIKNARERGFSIEEAARSFINAGYNPSEVKEVATFLSRGISPLPITTKETAVSALNEEIKEKPKSSRAVWITIIILALIITILAIVLLFFKEKILNIFASF